MRTKILGLLAVALLVGPVSASAAPVTIDFGPLIGADGSLYAGHTEDGFTLVPGADDWYEAHGIGNPAPSLLLSEGGGRIDVTGSLFEFSSLDLRADGAPNFTIIGLRLRGFAGGAPVAEVSIGNLLFPVGVFLTLDFPGFIGPFDLLVINLSTTADYPLHLDNLVFDTIAAVPEPGTLALLGLGLAGLGLARRHRAN